MPEVLVIEDGPRVELDGSPVQGTRHTVRFGSVCGSGERVAVKLERVPGALGRERVALAGLGASTGPVPRLLCAGRARLDEGPVECLVIERRMGAPPSSPPGWRRMGRGYGRLAERTERPVELPAHDRATFGAGHARRVAELGARLAGLATAIPDWASLCSDRVPGAAPLVITHGDPGPGNFLDDGGDGSIVDWEEAQVAPRGLDLARLVFIAWLGAGPRGYPARDHEPRAREVTAGYLDALREPWQPDGQEWRWWLTVAGVQFIHRRWRHGGPAPWQEATAVLGALLGAAPAR